MPSGDCQMYPFFDNALQGAKRGTDAAECWHFAGRTHPARNPLSARLAESVGLMPIAVIWFVSFASMRTTRAVSANFECTLFSVFK